MDEADMRVKDVVDALTPEHFTSGQVPSHSTVSSRLAGIGLQRDFVEAVADACTSDGADRERKMEEYRVLIAAVATRSSANRHRPDGPGVETELVRVQQRSLEVSDRLMRAMERATELERERNSANHMVLLLLAMVDKLHRDIATLSREQDRLRRSTPEQSALEQVRERLAHSEQQRATADAELERARAERQRADQLAEEAAQQVRVLSEELKHLRDQGAQSAEEQSQPPVTSSLPAETALDTEADDIDEALSKAARHLDDRADRLDRLAGELHSDNPPDNPATSTNAPDNSGDDRGPSLPSDAGLPSAGDPQASMDRLLDLATTLRSRGLDKEADAVLAKEGRTRPVHALPEVVGTLRAHERHSDAFQILTAIGQHRPALEVVEALGILRAAGLDADAYQVLSAVGRVHPVSGLIDVLGYTKPADAEWLLTAACRDRALEDLEPLRRLLQRASKYQEARLVEQAIKARHLKVINNGLKAGRTPFNPFVLTWGEDEGDNEENAGSHTDDADFPQTGFSFFGGGDEFAETAASPVVRPYAMTGGRTRARYSVPEQTIVTTTISAEALQGYLPDHVRICELCRTPTQVLQIATTLSIPIGVVRILVADLAEAGMVSIEPPAKQEK
jgi:hypothetical protein